MFEFIKQKLKSKDSSSLLGTALQLLQSNQKDYIPMAVDDSVRSGKILVFAPHPDDETIGCGGTIKLHLNRGDRVKVIVVTDGAKGYWQGDTQSYIQVRKQEAKNAFHQLGVQDYDFFGLEDQGIEISPEICSLFKENIINYNPDVIYCPSLNEIHRDHLMTSCLVLATVKSLQQPMQTLEYEIGNPVEANLLVNITSVIETKKSALSCYESQLVAQDIIGKALALNRYRTINVDDATIVYLEAFRSTIWA